MKQIALALSLCSVLLVSTATVNAAEATKSASPGEEAGVVQRVENAVERGVSAAASGVQRGVNAAARGVTRGASAAAHGIQRAASATAGAVDKTANKIGIEPAPATSAAPK